ncbi:hypothetical protein EV121DRAFT_274747 [Schizophyllum commune]
MAIKAFPKRKGCFQLELQRQSWAPPASDTSVLVATRRRRRRPTYWTTSSSPFANRFTYFYVADGIETYVAFTSCPPSYLGDEVRHERPVSISRCLFRPTRGLAFAFKHGRSLHFKRTLAHFLKCTLAHFLKRAFALAFEFAFTLKLIPFPLKSNLGLKLILGLKLMITILKLTITFLKLILAFLKLTLTLKRTTPTR